MSGCFRRALKILCVLAIAECLTASGVLAQKPRFDIEGVVTDAQQAVLPGGTGTLQNTATGLVRTVVTDASGRYVITALPPEGQYSINGLNNQNYVSEGYLGIIGNVDYGKPTGGANVFPGRQYQFAATYRF